MPGTCPRYPGARAEPPAPLTAAVHPPCLDSGDGSLTLALPTARRVPQDPRQRRVTPR